MEFLDTIPNICEGFPFNKGDSVLLNFWGDNDDLVILDSLSENLSKKGIIPFTHHCSNFLFENVVLNLIKNNQKFSADYLSYLSSFKSVIDIFMYTPSLPGKISEPEIPIFKEYLGELFNALSNDKKYYIQLNVPTKKNALNAGLDYDIYHSLLCNALSVDFSKLKKSCMEKAESLKGKNHIEIVTDKNHLLNLDIHNREWFIDDGCGDLPPGEVYIAPIENNSNGALLVPIVNLKGQIYNDVLLTFKNGILVNTSSTEIDNFLDSLPLEYKILCEFGIGLNPQVTELVGFTPIDEKALGTYHIGIGMNHFFGGENNCPFHMDFVFTSDNITYR